MQNERIILHLCIFNFFIHEAHRLLLSVSRITHSLFHSRTTLIIGTQVLTEMTKDQHRYVDCDPATKCDAVKTWSASAYK
jgi:hypothetical protein